MKEVYFTTNQKEAYTALKRDQFSKSYDISPLKEGKQSQDYIDYCETMGIEPEKMYYCRISSKRGDIKLTDILFMSQGVTERGYILGEYMFDENLPNHEQE